MMGAVIDIGNNTMTLPRIGKTVPLFVDYSGYLVIEMTTTQMADGQRT